MVKRDIWIIIVLTILAHMQTSSVTIAGHIRTSCMDEVFVVASFCAALDLPDSHIFPMCSIVV